MKENKIRKKKISRYKVEIKRKKVEGEKNMNCFVAIL